MCFPSPKLLLKKHLHFNQVFKHGRILNFRIVQQNSNPGSHCPSAGLVWGTDTVWPPCFNLPQKKCHFHISVCPGALISPRNSNCSCYCFVLFCFFSIDSINSTLLSLRVTNLFWPKKKKKSFPIWHSFECQARPQRGWEEAAAPPGDDEYAKKTPLCSVFVRAQARACCCIKAQIKHLASAAPAGSTMCYF